MSERVKKGRVKRPSLFPISKQSVDVARACRDNLFESGIPVILTVAQKFRQQQPLVVERYILAMVQEVMDPRDPGLSERNARSIYRGASYFYAMLDAEAAAKRIKIPDITIQDLDAVLEAEQPDLEQIQKYQAIVSRLRDRGMEVGKASFVAAYDSDPGILARERMEASFQATLDDMPKGDKEVNEFLKETYSGNEGDRVVFINVTRGKAELAVFLPLYKLFRGKSS